jgi:hypothetical protein
MDGDRIQRIELALCQWIFRTSVSKASLFGTTERKHRRGISRFSINQLAESLKLDQQIDQANEFDMRLRLALHLAPIDAIEWDPKRPESRVDVIHEFLRSEYDITPTDAESVSRDVASILTSWETRRRSLASKVSYLLESQSNRCASCLVEITEERILKEENKTLEERDLFKPYFDEPGVRTWLSAEVDHIVPVSTFGTNFPENLQVLCKLCNSGKANDVGVTVFQEHKFASKQIDSVCPQHRRRLFFFRLKMDENRCTKCHSESNELTVRKVREKGGLLLSNLISVCYPCI